MVEKLDAVSENLRDYYSEKDGKFVLQVEGAIPKTEIVNLESALRKERENARTFERKLKDFDGINPAEFHSLKDELDELKLRTPDSKNFDPSKLSDAQKQALFGETLNKTLEIRTRKYETEAQKLRAQLDEISQAKAQLESQYTGEKLRVKIAELTNGKIVPSAQTDAMTAAQLALKWDADAKDFIDEHGTPIKDWIETAISERPHWLPASKSGGAQGGTGSGGAAPKTAQDLIAAQWSK
jgi:hypothetical protein